MIRKIRTLLFSTLYPSSSRPMHGIFVETRLRELLRTGEAETKVIAPVPWFPSTNSRFGDYAKMAATPLREMRNGIDVLHPRYPLIPKIGMAIAPFLLAAASIAPVRRLLTEGSGFDLIDAHYYYPDGVAAVMLARWFHKPVTVTARGTDLNLIPKYLFPRAMMRWAGKRADASIGVCSALTTVLRDWNLDRSRLHVMRNGVDLDRFQPLPQKSARRKLDLQALPLLLSVGLLIERKGHHITIEAMPSILASHPGAMLVIVGEGEERRRLETQIHGLGLEQHVRLIGAVPNDELACWYSAADVLILASSREGWANVLLEAMACGTPVVATNVWGTPEIVTESSGGVVIERRDAESIANAVCGLIRTRPEREQVRTYAEQFGWEQTSFAQLALFRQLVEGFDRGSHA